MVAITIDGPSAAGKSTLAKSIAERLNFLYVDTGALYRAIGLAVLQAGADTKDEAAVAALLSGVRLELRHENGEQVVLLGDEDVSAAVRDEKVGLAASEVSAHQPVRDFLLETQRKIAQENDVIMDGRDIGTVVLPKADIKIFLTANPEDRAHRRYEQILQRGEKADYDIILKDVEQRDYNDSHRAASPLRKAEGAIEVVTNGFTFEQSLELLLSVIQERLPQAESAQ